MDPESTPPAPDEQLPQDDELNTELFAILDNAGTKFVTPQPIEWLEMESGYWERIIPLLTGNTSELRLNVSRLEGWEGYSGRLDLRDNEMQSALVFWHLDFRGLQEAQERCDFVAARLVARLRSRLN